jgi:phosphate starvation-inducible PhoH-like protein
MAKKAIRKPDNSPYIYQQKKVSSVDFKLSDRIPWKDRQKEFFDIMADRDTRIMFLSGVAGTGKTVMAFNAALQSLQDKKVTDITYLRVPVENSKHKMGSLPGTLSEKAAVYFEPMYSKLEELVGIASKDALLNNGLVEGKVINFLRGSHMSVKYIIFDEAQNGSFDDFLVFLTRLGEKTKVIICGDPMQSDIGKGNSAFIQFMDAFDTEEARSHGIRVFKMGKEDIVRSELLKYIVEVIEKM